jgi:hypothetical protein
MKLFNNTIAKVQFVLSLFLFIGINLQAASFVLENDNLIDPRAVEKIDAMGNELQQKTGINVYVIAKQQYPTIKSDDMKKKIESIKLYEKSVIKRLNAPYILLTTSFADTHINLIKSDDIKNIVDKDDILDTYVIPLLASQDKNDMRAKVSAALLNGYGEICDEIAEQQNIKLETSMGSGGTTFSAIWKVFMYTLVVFGILAYTYIIMREKKKGY